jgi:hypothetical protein
MQQVRQNKPVAAKRAGMSPPPSQVKARIVVIPRVTVVRRLLVPG